MLNNTLETEPCYRKYLFYEPCTYSLNEGPVHTFVFLFENAYISISLGLLSTLICWAFPLKMHLFEKCTWEVEQNEFTYVLYECGRSKIVKNTLKWKAWPKNIAGVCAGVVAWSLNSTYVTTHNSIIFKHLSVDSQRCMIKTVVWMRIDRCVSNDNKNAYFWKCTSVDSPRPPGGYFRNFWVGMCRWDPGTLNLPELVQLNFATLY